MQTCSYTKQPTFQQTTISGGIGHQKVNSATATGAKTTQIVHQPVHNEDQNRTACAKTFQHHLWCHASSSGTGAQVMCKVSQQQCQRCETSPTAVPPTSTSQIAKPSFKRPNIRDSLELKLMRRPLTHPPSSCSPTTSQYSCHAIPC